MEFTACPLTYDSTYINITLYTSTEASNPKSHTNTSNQNVLKAGPSPHVQRNTHIQRLKAKAKRFL